jgi:2'-5' RNA ligase
VKLSAVLYVLSVPTWAPEVGERIEAFRRAYEPARAAIVPAHITLVFGVRAISQEALTAHVAEITRRTAPFRVSFSTAVIHEDSIGGGYKLFLMTDEGAHALSTLHQAMYAGCLRPELRTDICYRPHMTIATADSAEGIRMALANVPRLGLPLSGAVEDLRVCAKRQHGIETIATLALAA